MKIPLKILITSAPEPQGATTWEDAFDDWEAYEALWQDFTGSGFIIDEAPILDMFGDETINIKTVVKDLSDPKKLFTDVSRSFTVPASKKNNKIFKHYYNIDILQGLDSRELIPCKLLLNNTTYKVGNLNIEGVGMSKGMPTSYKIRFIGKLSELARRIGQDELSVMDFSDIDETDFDSKAQFSDNTADPLCFPLSSRSDRFVLDSVTRDLGFDNTKNVRYVGSVIDDNYALIDKDLIGALSVGTILDKIANTYNISFDGIFDNDYIRDLYLWLHKTDKTRSGEQNQAQATNFTQTSTGTFGTPSDIVLNTDSFVLPSYESWKDYTIRIKGIWTGSATLRLKQNGNVVREIAVSNQYTSTYSFSPSTMTIDMVCDGNIAADVFVEITETYNETGEQGEGGYRIGTYEGDVTVGSGGSYYISENIPQMKIMDFLGSIFKMFNIVATVDDTNKVTGRHFDYFMSQGSLKDFSEYVDVTKYEVNKPNLYSSIRFKFADPKVAMELGYQKVNGKKYGELGYQLTGQNGVKLSGSEYLLEVQNQRVPVEPLRDLATNNDTGVVYTQFADLKGAEQATKPMFTYIARKSNATPIAWYDGISVSSVNTYVQPSNIFCTNSSAPVGIASNNKVGLYFGEELNEYNTAETRVGNGLFSCFYRGLTAMMFDEDKRMVKFQAYLPLKEVINLNLADTITINNHFYNINSIDTNYLTGKSSLELTLVGKSELSYFKRQNLTITNDSSSQTLKITYISWTGNLTQKNISVGNNFSVNYIGQLLSFNHEDYTIS